jgi:uncharacterized short protein YbdD (DUF466 family)
MPANANGNKAVASRVRRAAKAFWRGLRAWSGDSAYERYLRAVAAQGCADRPLSREDFYVEQLQRRFSRPNRCC